MSDLPAIGPDGAVFARRSAPGKPAAEDEGRQSSAGFDAILCGFAQEKSSTVLRGAEGNRASEGHGPLEGAAFAPGHASGSGSVPEADQMLSALFDDAHPDGSGLPELGERAVGVEPPELAERPVSVAEIDVAENQSALASAIAHHLAAMLDGVEQGSPKTTLTMTPKGQGSASQAGPVAPPMSGQEVAAADRGGLGQSGRLETPAFRVTRHEMHFRPVFSSEDGPEAERHLTGKERSGRHGLGAINGLRMRVSSAVGTMLASAWPVRSTGGDAGHMSRFAVPAGMMPGLAHDAGLLTADMPPGRARDADAGFRVAPAKSLLRPEAAQAAGPLRVLHIQLQPAELGRIELRLRTTDDGLEVHVEASRRETHALLQQDRDLIAGILRKIGHPVEMVTISIGERLTETMVGNGDAQGSDGRLGATSGEAEYGAGRSGQGQASPMAENRDGSGAQDDQDPPVLAARHRDSLYL